MIAAALRLGCIPKSDSTFFSAILDDDPSAAILAPHGLPPASEAALILAGPVALARYHHIPIDGSGAAINFVFNLAKAHAPQNPRALLDSWIECTRLIVAYEIGFATLILSERLATDGVLSGWQAYQILKPFCEFWHNKGPSPVAPLRIERSDSFHPSQKTFYPEHP